LITDVNAMVGAALTDARAGHNVWIEGRTVKNGTAPGRGSIEDTVAVFALVIDDDGDKGRTGRNDIAASLITETSPGNGHRWLFLEKALPPAQGKEAGDRLRACTGADSDTGTITQPYRVAGTPNYPDKRKWLRGRHTTEPTRILDHGGKLWTADELRKQFPPMKKYNGNGQDTTSSAPENVADLDPDLLNIIQNGARPDEDRSARFHGVVGRLKQCGWSIDSITALFGKYPNGIANKYQRRLSEEVERSYGKIETNFDLDELNRLYALVTIGSDVRVMALTTNPPVYYRTGDFRTLLSNRAKQIDTAKSIPLANWWLSHPQRRQYSGVVFEPGEPETVRGNRNLWTGFTVNPRKGDCSRYLNFLREVICSGNESHYNYLLNLMADTVQHPNKQGEIAPVLRGKEGVGKGFAIRKFGHLFGRHFLPVTQAAHVTGKFNGHLAYCSILFADEAFFAGDRQHESALKALITEPIFMIERKGIDAIRARNLTHVWISSNEDWVVPAGATARRFFCLNVSDSHRNDFEYFAAIDSQMREGGYEALLYELLNRDLCDTIIRNVPQTDALAEQKALTRRGVDALVEWLASEGSLPCADFTHPDIVITVDPDRKETFYEMVKKIFPSLRYITPTTITRTLKSDWACQSWHSTKKRGVRFPPLPELRKLFTAKYGPIKWPADNENWE